MRIVSLVYLIVAFSGNLWAEQTSSSSLDDGGNISVSRVVPGEYSLNCRMASPGKLSLDGTTPQNDQIRWLAVPEGARVRVEVSNLKTEAAASDPLRATAVNQFPV